MLDTIEQLQDLNAMPVYDRAEGHSGSLVTQAIVPMLDWPTDLFQAFTAEVDDEFE